MVWCTDGKKNSISHIMNFHITKGNLLRNQIDESLLIEMRVIYWYKKSQNAVESCDDEENNL